MNKRIDGIESNLNQKMDNLQYSISKINKLLEVQERGRFPSQTLPNDIYKFITLLPKDYCLIPGNGAKNF